MQLIEPLLVDQEDQPDDLETNEDFADEQTLVARFVNLIHAPTTDQQFLVGLCILGFVVYMTSMQKQPILRWSRSGITLWVLHILKLNW